MTYLKFMLLGFATCIGLMPANVFAQGIYPKEPIRLVITHAAGGTTDMAARLIQPYLQKYLGVPIVIENMQGAGGNVADRSYSSSRRMVTRCWSASSPRCRAARLSPGENSTS